MDVVEQINKLKKEKNAVILVHNYQPKEIQDIGDFVGDSLGLSIQAKNTDKDIIVFCGVYFMAETAKILSPNKTVIIPDKNAGCPMANMITKEQLIDFKAKHPKAKVICYVNSTAEVKALVDVCVTSANADKIVEKMFSTYEEVIFIPDKYLAMNTAKKLGRKFILWEGYCPSHVKILPEHVLKQKELHPNAKFITHPECPPVVTSLADAVLSTEGMVNFVKTTDAKEVIVGTEINMIHRLKKENPNITYYPASTFAVCPNMQKTNLNKVLNSLENLDHEIILDEEIIKKANNSIQKMVSVI